MATTAATARLQPTAAASRVGVRVGTRVSACARRRCGGVALRVVTSANAASSTAATTTSALNQQGQQEQQQQPPVECCDVVVVGAGPGGLAAALALQNEGFDVRVVERKASFCRAGAAVFIWPHGMQNLLTICPEACEQVRSALHREDLPIPIV